MQKTTKRALTASALVLGLIAVTTTANAAIATTGIASTRHNLGSSNRNGSGLTTPTGTGNLARDGDVFTSATDEICVFCHTPHANNTAANPPLWNKALPLASNYTVYTSGTMQATSVMAGSMSLACLSCHDGTQAMDNMINAPGGNGYTAPGAGGVGGGATLGAGNLWSGDGADTVGGIMQTTAGIVMLGTDLTNDHPVGIKYCGGGATTSSVGACADTDFNVPTNNGYNTGFMVGSDPVQKKNMRLYGSAVADATVECASCHDPHNDQAKTFLRISNTGSQVCLTCHAK